MGRGERIVFGGVVDMTKREMPLRCGNTSRGEGKRQYNNYTPEFDERQAEEIWKRDFAILVLGVVAVLVLCVVGVI